MHVAAVTIRVRIRNVMQSIDVIFGLALVWCEAPQVYLGRENLCHCILLYYQLYKAVIMR